MCVKVWCVLSTYQYNRLSNILCFCIWIEKKQILVISDASYFVAYSYCLFYKDFKDVSYSKHKNSFMFLKFIKRKALDNSMQAFVTQYVSHELLDFVTLDTMAVQH